jgi:hypothetical protein
VWKKAEREGALVQQVVYGKKEDKKKEALRKFKELN